MNKLIKAIMVSSMFASCSFASGAKIPDIAIDTLPSVWEAIDLDHLRVYQLEICSDLSGVLVVVQEGRMDVDVYEIAECEIIPRGNGTELIVDLKNADSTVRLRGSGVANENMGHLDMELLINPREKTRVLELVFVKPLHGTPYIEGFYDMSLRASKAREAKWKKDECNHITNASRHALPVVAKDTLTGLWEAESGKGYRVFQLDIRPDGKGILVYALSFQDSAYAYCLKKIDVVEGDETQDLILDFAGEDGSLVRLSGTVESEDSTGELNLQFDMNPLGKPNTWDLNFIKADDSTHIQKLYDLSQRANRAREAEYDKEALEKAEVEARTL